MVCCNTDRERERARTDTVCRPSALSQCCVSVGYTIHICGPSPRTKSFPRGLHVGRDWPFLAGTYTIIVVCNLVAISWTYEQWECSCVWWCHVGRQLTPGSSCFSALAAPGYALLLVAAFIECLLALSLVACSDPGIVRPHLNDIQPGIGVNYCGTERGSGHTVRGSRTVALTTVHSSWLVWLQVSA